MEVYWCHQNTLHLSCGEMGDSKEENQWKLEVVDLAVRLNELFTPTSAVLVPPWRLLPATAYIFRGCMMCDRAVTGIEAACSKSNDCCEECGEDRPGSGK